MSSAPRATPARYPAVLGSYLSTFHKLQASQVSFQVKKGVKEEIIIAPTSVISLLFRGAVFPEGDCVSVLKSRLSIRKENT